MASIRALLKHPPTDRRRSQDTRNDQGLDASPNGDARAEQVLENRHTTSQEETLKRIASLPHILQDRVLDLRQHIADGTYEVADRLDKSIDRILESLTA
jgi:anti-sigma28 factor (negative regulator of flagellin synthesis)